MSVDLRSRDINGASSLAEVVSFGSDQSWTGGSELYVPTLDRPPQPLEEDVVRRGGAGRPCEGILSLIQHIVECRRCKLAALISHEDRRFAKARQYPSIAAMQKRVSSEINTHQSSAPQSSHPSASRLTDTDAVHFEAPGVGAIPIRQNWQRRGGLAMRARALSGGMCRSQGRPPRVTRLMSGAPANNLMCRPSRIAVGMG